MTLRSITRNPERADEYNTAKETMIRFATYNKLRKVALMIVAHKSTTTEIGTLRKIFQKYDTLRTGQVKYDQFKAVVEQAGYTEEEMTKIFQAVDLDGSGVIRYTEFLAATIEARGTISEQRLAEAFATIDSSSKGYISADDLRDIVGPTFPQEEINEILNEVSKDRDGRVSYSEFLSLWEDHNETENAKIQQQHHQSNPSDSSSSLLGTYGDSFRTNSTNNMERTESGSSNQTSSSEYETDQRSMSCRAGFIAEKQKRLLHR